MQTIEQLTESILNVAVYQRREEAQIVIADLLRKHLIPYVTAAIDAKALIRQWHGMRMPTRHEHVMWAIYEKNAPEMKSINAALDGTE